MDKFQHILFIFLAFTCASISAFSQNNLSVSYSGFNTVPDFLNICGTEDEVVVRISLEGGAAQTRSNISAAAQLFKGVELVNFNSNLSTAGVTLVDDSNPNNPIFSIPDLSPNGQTFADIAFSIRANCGVVDSLDVNDQAQVFDLWETNYDLGTMTNLSETDAASEYRDAFAIPFFTVDIENNNPKAKVNECFSRELTVINSSLDGFVDNLTYQNSQGSGIWITGIEVNGIPISIEKIEQPAGDTLITAEIDGSFFQNNQSGNGDNFFNPNEILTITEFYCVVSCVEFTGSNHDISWGCDGDICRTSSTIDFVELGEGAANIGFNFGGSLDEEFAGYCIEGQTTITFTNDGIEFDAGFATMLDVETGIGFGGGFSLENGGYNITGIRIAGIDITDFQTLNLLHGNAQFATDPDGAGGLSDEDGDGFFDDLALNESIEITAFYEFDCSLASDIDFQEGCTNDFGTGFNGRIIYTDACQDRLTHSENNYLRPSNSNSNIENFADPDAFAEDIFFVTHTESRSVRFFERNCNGEEVFIVKVVLPPNVNPVIDQTEFIKNTFSNIPLLSDEIDADGTLVLTYDASFSNFLNGDYELRLAFQADCEAEFGATEFPTTIEFSCPACDCAHLWYCGILDGPQLHGTNPPCPPDLLLDCERGIQTTDFSIERTSLGFTDQTYSTQIDKSDANLKVGISCDEVEMKIQNVVGETPISDNIGMVITYNNPDESTSPAEIFLFQEAEVRIIQNGSEFTCTVFPDILMVETDTSAKKLTFDLSACLTDANLTLTAGDSIEFLGKFSINKDGPFLTQFRKVPNLRAYGFAIIDGAEESCDNFGENFTIAKNLIAFDFPNNNDFPSGCQDAALEYRLITVNNGFSEFFPNEFRQASRVDSIIFDYDPAILEAFDNISVEVSIPDHPIFGNDFFPLPSLTEFPDGNYTAAFDTLLQVPSYNSGSSTTFNLRINLTPTCRSNVGSSNQSSLYDFDAKIHYIDRFYASLIGDGTCSENIIDSVNSIVSYEEPPTFSLTPVTNTEFILFGDTAEWIVQHCNTSFESDAGLTWLAIEDPTETITIVEMQDISDPNNPIDLPINYYGTGSNAFAFTNGLLRSNGTNSLDEMCNFIKIRAIANNCEDVNFDVRTGWNCTDYDEIDWTPEIYPPCEDIALGLSLTFRDPFLDANIVDQPATNPNICDITTITILLRNIDRGAAFDVQTQLILPLQGATLVPNSVEFAYPSSADFQAVAADPAFVGSSLNGNIYQYDDFANFNDFLNQNGLPGFNTTNPTDSNEIKIRYSFVTNCDFLSGGLSFYNFQGFQGCGDPSNFEAGESFPLIIAGTEPDLTKLFQVEFTPASVLVPNALSILEINLTNLTNTPTDEETDLIKLSLPPDLVYENGTTLAIFPNDWDLGEPEITTQNGFQVLNWKMPDGLVLNEQARFQIQVNTPNYDCDAADQEVQLMTVSRQELFCETTDEDCQVETITATTGVDLTALPIGSGLGIEFETVTSVCFNENEELVTVSGNLFNNSFEINDEEFNFSFFIDANENGQIDPDETTTEIFNITGTVGPNNPLTFEFTLPIEIADLCRIILQVEAQNVNDCGAAMLAMPTPTLINAGENQVFCATENQTFTTEIGDPTCVTVQGYNLTWTALPPATEASLSDIKVPTPTITFEHDGIGNDTLFYVLETQRPNCDTPTFDTVAIILAEGVDLENPAPITIFPTETTQLIPNILSGTGPFNFQWNADPTLSATNIPNPFATPEETTDYFLTVTNGFGCTDTATFTVQVVTPVVAEVTPEIDTICAEHTLQLQASGGEVYVWMPSPDNPPGGMLSFPAGSDSPVFSGGLAGNTYIIDVIVSLMDFPDFPDTAQVSITIFDAPTADAGEDVTICSGDQIQLNGTVSTGNIVEYIWNPAPLFGQGTATPTIQLGNSTTYSLTVINENGCSNSDEISVTVEDCDCDEPVVNTVNTTFANCDGALGSAEILVEGDASQLTFQWSPDLGTPNNLGNERTDLPAGGYSVIIAQNNDPNCQTEIFIAIENEDGPQATVQTTPAACNDLTGTATLSPANFNYQWADGNTQNTRNDLPVGTYFVTVTDPQNPDCENVVTVVINDENPLIADVNIIAQPNCDEANGTVQIIVSGGSGNYDFSWPSGTDTQTDLAAGIYNVTITDLGSTGCELPVVFILTNDVPMAGIEIFDINNVNCFNGNDGGVEFGIVLENGVAEPIETIFSNGLNNFENNNLPAGSFCIQINDANGCVAGGECFDITQPDPISVQTQVTQGCDGNGTITLNVSGGTPNYQFLWENVPNPTTQNQTNLNSDFYNVTVSDENNCQVVIDSIFVPMCIECDVFSMGDTAFVQAQTCETTGALCLEILEDDLPNKLILDNQNIYQGNFEHCNFTFWGNYNVSTLFGQGNSGPYQLVSWPGINENLNLIFNNLEELTQIMNDLDPNGNWEFNFPFITGGVEGTNYDQMEVLVVNFNLTSFIGFDELFVPSSFAIDLEIGSHEVIVIDTILGCRDTVYAEVVCTMPDTLEIDIFITDSLEICFPTDELIANFDSIYNNCPEEIFVEYQLESDTACLEIFGTMVGTETACIVICDSFNICDTNYLIINVLPPPCITDSIVVSQISEYCLDTMGLTLTGEIETAEIVCATNPGGSVNYSLDTETNCLIYEGLSIGVDSTCVQVCDANGNCDTLDFCISVLPGDLITDTIQIIQDTVEFCIDTTNLAGNIISITDICPDENGDNVQFIIDPETYCITYFGETEGIDAACILLEDDLGNVWLTNFIITAIKITAETYCDTLFINDPRTFCPDTTELPGNVSEIFNICEDESEGNVDVFLNFVNYCVQYDGKFLGTDTACVVICDDLGFCDTTNFCFLVEANFDPPNAEDDIDSTFAGTPIVLDIKANDTLFGGEPVITIIKEPDMGEVVVNLDCSVTYNPFVPFCDNTDNFIYEVCIDGHPDFCDTATVFIDVICQELTVFNAVSPNGDGFNDYFHIGKIEDFPDNKVQIFNRWNNLVYETTGYSNQGNKSWPATWADEKDLPDGTYFYILEWVDDNGVRQVQRGYVEVLR